jgi:hypothetical protein
MRTPPLPESNISLATIKKTKSGLTLTPRIFKSDKSFLINANSTGPILKFQSISKKEKNFTTKALAKNLKKLQRNLNLLHNFNKRRKPKKTRVNQLIVKDQQKKRKRRKTKRKILKEPCYQSKNHFQKAYLITNKKANQSRKNKKWPSQLKIFTLKKVALLELSVEWVLVNLHYCTQSWDKLTKFKVLLKEKGQRLIFLKLLGLEVLRSDKISFSKVNLRNNDINKF